MKSGNQTKIMQTFSGAVKTQESLGKDALIIITGHSLEN